MKFEYCPYCGSKLIKKEIGDEGMVPYCTSCSEPMFDLPVSCTITLAVNEYNEAVLIRQSYGKKGYVCVAGYIKIGESAEECAAREVEEELGIKPYSIEYINSYTFDKKEMLMLGFMARLKKADFYLSKEIESAEWFPINDALGKLRKTTVAAKLVENCIERIDKSGC